MKTDVPRGRKERKGLGLVKPANWCVATYALWLVGCFLLLRSFLFWRARFSAFLILLSSSESTASSFALYSATKSQPASELSANLINLFLLFNDLIVDLTTFSKVSTWGAATVSWRESIKSWLKLNWSLFPLNLKSYVLYFSLFETRSVVSWVMFAVKDSNLLSIYVWKFSKDRCRRSPDEASRATRSVSVLAWFLRCLLRFLLCEAEPELLLATEACVSLLPLCGEEELLEVLSFRFLFPLAIALPGCV